MLWNWTETYVEKALGDVNPGGTVILGVAWYDKQFFDSRKDAHTNPAHLLKYLDIGIPLGQIKVTHWLFAGEGRA